MPSGIYESIPATPEEVEAFAETLTPAHLHCRVWGHDPFPQNTSIARDVEGVPAAHWDVALLCSHGCGVRWRVLASADGEVLKRRLDYSDAPGYISDHGRIDAQGKKVLRRTYFVQQTGTVGTGRKRKGRKGQ